ncbi:hypothetical protein M409DRAFT_31012 [Zasmidium cellare ATCC 36951]|uniref:Transglycosylase SLT domain-containing protein n=1 Tax=Zasmidium cellare ATCC 36951 TaxID=1080233 RepID=A0A6A6BX05_ZASCE|nr:uncharacterized protein M409DRAFT_31012 [Zasmidium cellare ATCC 36951]KAF2158480.1 hypothetical protein M409DRAFT_31012 [Zasmidium cellare ATCC 36951]
MANISQIVRDPQAQAALKAMKAAYPSTGSPDLTQEDIGIVYGDAIRTAVAKTTVPADMLSEIVWTESKGHPLVYNGLTQIDYVAWGQMADRDPQLDNRYLPTSNIVAAAMYLSAMKQRYGCAWDDCYRNHYQDPNLKKGASYE